MHVPTVNCVSEEPQRRRWDFYARCRRDGSMRENGFNLLRLKMKFRTMRLRAPNALYVYAIVSHVCVCLAVCILHHLLVSQYVQQAVLCEMFFLRERHAWHAYRDNTLQLYLCRMSRLRAEYLAHKKLKCVICRK